MLVGLLRLRHRGGGTYGLAQVLWRQVRRWFLQANDLSIHSSVFVSAGHHLALACIRGRDSASGESVVFSRSSPFVNPHSISQVFIILNLNGTPPWPSLC